VILRYNTRTDPAWWCCAVAHADNGTGTVLAGLRYISQPSSGHCSDPLGEPPSTSIHQHFIGTRLVHTRKWGGGIAAMPHYCNTIVLLCRTSPSVGST
jgi:hypothetical protein